MLYKNNIRNIAIFLVLSCLIAARALGQEQTVDAQTKDQLKVIMAHLLDTLYVSPETGKRLASQLQTKFESGAYKQITTPTKLAEALTRDLRELSKDVHLRVRYAPAASDGETILTPQEWERTKASMSTRGSAGPQAGPPPAGMRMRPPDTPTGSQQPQSNYHFLETKYLSGNIGYLKLDGFSPGPPARDKAAQTMALLANGDATIIDMRRCMGGSQEMVNFLASYFFDKEPRLLLTSYFRPTGETVQNKTSADIPGKRLLDTDLYLLVSANTLSACEAFAYILQQYGRAKVIGERTAGGGNHNFVVPMGKGYGFSVSIGSVVHPVSGKGWDGEGVQPDTAVKPDAALETAHREGLQKLINKTKDPNRKKELRSALQDVGRSSETPIAVMSKPASQAISPTQKPSLRGVWVLDKAKSEGLPPSVDQTLTIVQDGDKVEVATKTTSERGEQNSKSSYVLDGKEAEVALPGPMPGSTANGKQTSKWSADGKGFESSDEGTFETPNGPATIKTSRKFQLLSDGATLVIDISRDGPMPQKSKRVFTRAGTPKSPGTADLSQSEREVRALEREWLDAYEKRDSDAMNRIVADDFKLSYSDGSSQTKADILAQLKSGRDSGSPSPKFSTEDVQSRVEGDTVILTGRFIQQMERNGQPSIMQMTYTDIYAKPQGRWQVIASKMARIQPQ